MLYLHLYNHILYNEYITTYYINLNILYTSAYILSIIMRYMLHIIAIQGSHDVNVKSSIVKLSYEVVTKGRNHPMVVT